MRLHVRLTDQKELTLPSAATAADGKEVLASIKASKRRVSDLLLASVPSCDSRKWEWCQTSCLDTLGIRPRSDEVSSIFLEGPEPAW